MLNNALFQFFPWKNQWLKRNYSVSLFAEIGTTQDWVREVDCVVVKALSTIRPLAINGLASMATLRCLKRSMSVKNYYATCQDILSISKCIQEGSVARGLELMNRMHDPNGLNGQRGRNILFITSVFPSPLHGGGNRVLALLKNLSKRNKIFVVTTYSEKRDQKHEKFLSPYCEAILKISNDEWGQNGEQILEWLGGVQIDVVHYEWLKSLENYHRPLGDYHIFTFMECVSLRHFIDIQRDRGSSRKVREILPRMITSLKKELIDTLPMSAQVAVTEKDAKFLSELMPLRRYHVINTGYSFDDIELPEKYPEPQSMLFLGNYKHGPNVDAMYFFLEEIFPLIKREVANAKIYVVGPNMPRTVQRQFADPCIVFTGEVPDAREYIQRAEVCVAPLVSGAGMRGKLLDYAALRRAFVATEVAVAGLAFVDGVEFLLANSAQDFAQGTIHLLRDPALRQSLSERAYETARAVYDINKIGKLYERLYEDLERAR
jgi:glycosyltransferase involved in cell wall biosynthesis